MKKKINTITKPKPKCLSNFSGSADYAFPYEVNECICPTDLFPSLKFNKLST